MRRSLTLDLQNQMQQSLLPVAVQLLHDMYRNITTLGVLLGVTPLWPWLDPPV